jgi:hypothetical protein
MWDAFKLEFASNIPLYGMISLVAGLFIAIFISVGIFLCIYVIPQLKGISKDIETRLGPAPSDEMKKNAIKEMTKEYEDYMKNSDINYIKIGTYSGILAVIIWIAWIAFVVYFISNHIKG